MLLYLSSCRKPQNVLFRWLSLRFTKLVATLLSIAVVGVCGLCESSYPTFGSGRSWRCCQQPNVRWSARFCNCTYCRQAGPSDLMYSPPISFTTTGSCTLSMLCSCWLYYSQGTHCYHPSCVLQSNPCRLFCHARSAGLDDSECLYSLGTGSQPGRCWMLDG